MTEYHIFILDCITDLQKIYDTMYYEYRSGNISEKKFKSIKDDVDSLMFELKNLK